MIRSTANKYGEKKMDGVRTSQSESVGSPARIIKTTANMQGVKQDAVTKGSFHSHLPKGSGITTGTGKLVATSSYGKASKLA